jgi:hypothetical protein
MNQKDYVCGGGKGEKTDDRNTHKLSWLCCHNDFSFSLQFLNGLQSFYLLNPKISPKRTACKLNLILHKPKSNNSAIIQSL